MKNHICAIQKMLKVTMRTVLFLSITIFLQSGKTEVNWEEKTKAALQSFVNDADLKHAGIGFYFESEGTTVTHNEGLTLIPASVQKIITTGAALGILGEEYTFKTEIAYDGEIANDSTLKGNIYVIGGGDPTLGSNRIKSNLNAEAFLEKIAEAVKNKGIKKITGWIHLDLNRFDNALPVNWAWNDIGNYYGAGAYSLSFNENEYSVYLNAPSKVGADVEIVKYSHEIPGLRMYNNLKSGPASSGDNAYIFGAPYNYIHVLRGTIPAGSKNFEIKGSLPDPPLFFAQQLHKAFSRHGIYVTYPAQGNPHNHTETDALKLKPLITITSPPLKGIIYHTNLSSVNLYAEALLKEMGYKLYNEGSTEAGIKAVIDFWKKKGIDTNALFMHDGSGLSHYNGASAKQFVQMLKALQKEPYFNSFYNSLPIAGKTGAMRNIGKGTVIENKMRAKTGHMERIRSYCGYVENKNGKLIPFALMVNNYTCSAAEIKSKIEKLLVALGN